MENLGGTMDGIHRTIDAKGGSIFNQAEIYFDNLFRGKIPPLPAQIQDLLVRIAPFWAICLLVFGLFQILFGSLGAVISLFGTLLSIATLSGSGVISSVLEIIRAAVGLALGLIMLFFLAKSLSGLFNQKSPGWQALFRAEVISLLYAAFSWGMTILVSVVSFNGLGTLAGIGASIMLLPIWLIMFGLCFYLLFQIKDRYV